jgi:hypothetical protein
MRALRKIAVAALVLYVGALAGFLAVMRHPTLFGRVMRRVPEPAFVVIPFKRLWFIARAGRLQAGDAAPDFDLPSQDNKSRVRLASFRGREPVVLIFGSYT